MTGLNKEQIEFLKKHKIDESRLFNAKDMSPKEYRIKMKLLNRQFAYNVAPCKAKGHTLRSRSGHCIQCRTQRITFQVRGDSKGFVYIACSRKENISKIGYTKDLNERLISLNKTQYAGVEDWNMKLAIKSELAGRIEIKAQSLVRKYRTEYSYSHDGNIHESDETFSCTFEILEEALIQAAKGSGEPYFLITEI